MSVDRFKPTGEPIPKREQLVNIEDLYLKCREIHQMLQMLKNGKHGNCKISERRILHRFSYIITADLADIIHDRTQSTNN